MRKVYAWPPVGVTACDWTVFDPVATSRSVITGRSYPTAAGPRRRVASIDASALARGGMGGGYMEALKRLLDGGIHLVRLSSPRVSWMIDPARAAERSSSLVSWREGASPVGWTKADSPVLWYTGRILTATPLAADGSGLPRVRVSGLPPNQLAARPGEIVRVFSADESASASAMVIGPVTATSGGVATIRLDQPLPYGGRINIGDRESAIFEATSLPRSKQTVGQDWSYSWEFVEVLPDEGPFQEIDPW